MSVTRLELAAIRPLIGGNDGGGGSLYVPDLTTPDCCVIVELCETAAIILLAHRLNKYALLYQIYKASLVNVTISIYVEILLKIHVLRFHKL